MFTMVIKEVFNFKEFGDCIKKKRVVDAKLSLRDLGKMLEIDHATISQIENGNSTNLKNIFKLCGWMDYSVAEFIEMLKK